MSEPSGEAKRVAEEFATQAGVAFCNANRGDDTEFIEWYDGYNLTVDGEAWITSHLAPILDTFAAKAVEAERTRKMYYLDRYCEEHEKARKTRRALDAILDCNLSVKEMVRVENLTMAQKRVRCQRKELKQLWKLLAAERKRFADAKAAQLDVESRVTESIADEIHERAKSTEKYCEVDGTRYQAEPSDHRCTGCVGDDGYLCDLLGNCAGDNKLLGKYIICKNVN